jgi:ABC-2 type transport system ATP-binding protein
MSLIELRSLTKDYGHGRGVFAMDLAVEEGEVFGFVGTNGAGKTTTIRHLMGFLRPASGGASISGLDCWRDAAAIMRRVGYIPGEIAFPDDATGTAFLKRQAELLGVTDMAYANQLTDKLQLDPTANLKRMSKGMKQKTAIVAALMADPTILILDEPTTGLDPLMRAEFVDILNDEKAKGKTIFMSSHMFEEVEDTCDRVAFIKDGHIISSIATDTIRHNADKTYKIEFMTAADFERFRGVGLDISEERADQNQVLVQVHDSNVNNFTRLMTGYRVKFVKEIKHSLEEYFRQLY